MRTYPHYPRAEVQLNQDGTGKIVVQHDAEQEPINVSNVVSGVQVQVTPRVGTTVTLTLGWAQAAAEGHATVCDKTAAALLALGWTAPAVME